MIYQQTWSPLLKIVHRGQMQFLAYISKTKSVRAKVTGSQSDEKVKIYLLCNFQANWTTYCWVNVRYSYFFYLHIILVCSFLFHTRYSLSVNLPLKELLPFKDNFTQFKKKKNTMKLDTQSLKRKINAKKSRLAIQALESLLFNCFCK